MKRNFFLSLLPGIAVLLCSTFASAQHSNALTTKEKKEGWQLLFDGKSFNGWHTYGKKTVGNAWKVEAGAIVLDTVKKEGFQVHGGGDLVTNKEYENFHLKVEWKIAPCGNSGIIFLSHEDTAKYRYSWLTGPEMQVLDNDCHPDGKIHKHRAGDLYDLIASASEPVKPVGEWNLAEIILNKGHLELFLNGVKVVETQMWDDNWKKLVAGSKFKSMPDFGKYKKGHIVLQDHGNRVSFRNIKIKEL